MRDVNEAKSASIALASTLESVGRGDREAFEELYRRTAAKLFGICLRISTSRQEAEEALQEVYLSVWQRAGAYDRARGSAITWLAVVARNAAIDRRRRERPADGSADVLVELADASPLASDLIGDADDIRRLHACLGTIDAQDARMIRTAFLEGLSYPDLAIAAGLPLGTVKSRIRRAFLKLRACLQ